MSKPRAECQIRNSRPLAVPGVSRGYGIPGLRCNAWGSVHTRFCADRSLTTFVVPRYTIRAGLSARIALVVSASFILTYIYKRVSIHYSRDWWFGYPPARGPLPRPRAVLLPPRMRRLYPSLVATVMGHRPWALLSAPVPPGWVGGSLFTRTRSGSEVSMLRGCFTPRARTLHRADNRVLCDP